MKKLALLVLLGITVLCTGAEVCLAQTQSPFAIRVEAPEVAVPVVVLDRTHFQKLTETTLEELDEEVTDLSAEDFRIYEDGVKQEIRNVGVELPRYWDARDNISHHVEQSTTPRGIWAGPDLWPGSGPSATLYPLLRMYLVSYVPPASAEGSCHRIKVKVARHHATVYARDEYCNTKHPPSDPMYGTNLGKQMEEYAESGQEGKFPVSVQAVALFGKAGANRVDIAVEFPWSELKREWHGVNLYATIAVLGMVYDSNGALVERFSDVASTSPWNFYRGPLPPDRQLLRDWELAGIPNRYETQIELPAGEYELEVVVTDGEKFSGAKVPLKVDTQRRKELAMSEIVLCRRFHEVTTGAQKAARAPQYVPLVSNGLEFTPAGDTVFKRGERVLSYLEIYEPRVLLPGGTDATDVQLQMRVTEAKTGDVKVDSGVRSVEAGRRVGNGVIPVAGEMASDTLSAGRYRLEVRALDSTGKSSGWRAVEFRVE